MIFKWKEAEIFTERTVEGGTERNRRSERTKRGSAEINKR